MNQIANPDGTSPRTSTTAVLSLIAGIISWCGLYFIGGIVAVILGHVARSEIRQAPPGSVDGDGLALAGLILGYINIVVSLLGVLVVVLFFGGIALLAGLGG